VQNFEEKPAIRGNRAGREQGAMAALSSEADAVRGRIRRASEAPPTVK
jgi:hypothetical protein